MDEKLGASLEEAHNSSPSTNVKFEQGVDVSVLLMEAHEDDSRGDLDPEVARKLKNKLDRRLLPLLFLLYGSKPVLLSPVTQLHSNGISQVNFLDK